MNRFLAGGLSFINALAAFVIVLVSTIAGVVSGLHAEDLGEPVVRVLGGGALGLALGVFYASLICGFIATLIGIYAELRTIRQQLHASAQLQSRGGATAGSGSRREPQVL